MDKDDWKTFKSLLEALMVSLLIVILAAFIHKTTRANLLTTALILSFLYILLRALVSKEYNRIPLGHRNNRDGEKIRGEVFFGSIGGFIAVIVVEAFGITGVNWYLGVILLSIIFLCIYKFAQIVFERFRNKENENKKS